MTDAQPGVQELHLDPTQWEAVDAIARDTARDRQSVLEEAIDAYIALHRWQVAHIQEGLRQVQAGEFADESEVARAFRRPR